MFLAIVVSGVLKVPRYKAFKARQERRAAIRSQFETQVASAKAMLNPFQVNGAAIALIRAEFPVHTEANLFGRTELDSFDRCVEAVRQEIDELNARNLERREIAKREREVTQKELREREPGGDSEVIHSHVDVDTRENVIAKLLIRAALQLKSGNNLQARGICEQIVELDPVHRFDEKFWANVLVQ